MSDTHSTPLSLARLRRDEETAFQIVPDAAARTAVQHALDLLGLRKLRFAGRLMPEGQSDWRLEATLGATVVQPCVVTMGPVTTRIDEPVVRRYIAGWTEPEGDEVEMDDDDTCEALPATLDLEAVMTEALALALPAFPRAQGVELGEAVFAPPGVAPMRDRDAKPLAGLAALRARLGEQETGDETGEETGEEAAPEADASRETGPGTAPRTGKTDTTK